jgi:hypothetical protein
MVNTREDAQRLVAYTHYAPQGTRSFGPVRASAVRRRRLPDRGQQDHRRLRDDRDRAGAGQPGRHPVGGRAGRDLHRPVGPVAGAGLQAGVRRRRPKVAQAIDHIVEARAAHGVQAGIHNGRPDVALARIAKGFRFVTVSSDAPHAGGRARRTCWPRCEQPAGPPGHARPADTPAQPQRPARGRRTSLRPPPGRPADAAASRRRPFQAHQRRPWARCRRPGARRRGPRAAGRVARRRLRGAAGRRGVPRRLRRRGRSACRRAGRTPSRSDRLAATGSAGR